MRQPKTKKKKIILLIRNYESKFSVTYDTSEEEREEVSAYVIPKPWLTIHIKASPKP